MPCVMEKTAGPVPAQDAVQVPHPPRCWICEIVVELGIGDGGGVGEVVGEVDETDLGKFPCPHPLNRIENK